jgi:uncharacterized protein YicC (UPF0701 family)
MFWNLRQKAIDQAVYCQAKGLEKVDKKPKKAEVEADPTLYTDEYMAMYKCESTSNDKGQSKWGGFDDGGKDFYVAAVKKISKERKKHGQKISEMEALMLQKIKDKFKIVGNSAEENAAWKKRKSLSGAAVPVPKPKVAKEICIFSDSEKESSDEED